MKHSTFSKVIENEAEYHETSRVLAQKKRPPAVLRLLMNSFESYRQARKFGWSRPWNKINLMNFQSFKLDCQHESQLLQLVSDLLHSDSLIIPQEANDFCVDLLQDNALMGFVFVHEYRQDEETCYEGATLSLGRVSQGQGNRRYRDRMDIIVESRVIDGVSQGFERARIYIDPYRPTDKKPLWQGQLADNNSIALSSLFTMLSEISWLWAGDSSHLWNHWTSAYIDYFGDRQGSMSKSYFFMEQAESGRIDLTIDHKV
jgi:hypothetical protein